MKQKMITIGYSRIPQETVYHVKMDVDMVELEGTTQHPEALHRWTATGSTMDEIIEVLHYALWQHPEATVTMIQEPSKGPIFGRRLKGFELDQQTVDLIREDLKKAQEMFQPIERTVHVSPPRIALRPEKETDDGDEHEK